MKRAKITPPLMNELRKHGIYTQYNFIHPQKKMKFCHLQVKGWKWRIRGGGGTAGLRGLGGVGG
jgi:hypothetical protein